MRKILLFLLLVPVLLIGAGAVSAAPHADYVVDDSPQQILDIDLISKLINKSSMNIPVSGDHKNPNEHVRISKMTMKHGIHEIDLTRPQIIHEKPIPDFPNYSIPIVPILNLTGYYNLTPDDYGHPNHNASLIPFYEIEIPVIGDNVTSDSVDDIHIDSGNAVVSYDVAGDHIDSDNAVVDNFSDELGL